MDLTKRSDETPLQYHKRLVYGKLVDRTLSDVDYSELSKYVYGKRYAPDVARRHMYGSRYTLDLIDKERAANVSDSSLLSEIDKKLIELKKEKQKFFDQRNALNKIIRERSRQEELNEILENAIKNGNLPELKYERVYVDSQENTLLCSLNDIHYGINVDNAWNTYNPDICKTMMRNYLNKIISIAETHKSDKCIVYNCGDSISGLIHLTIQIANKENVIEQVKGVSELISQFLAELSKHFNSVKYVSVSGNHSRLSTKDDSPYDERMDDLIDWYLAARLHDFKNVTISTTSRIDPSMFLLDVYGKAYLGVHGDFDAGNTKIAALQAMVQQPLYAVLSGHKHHNARDEVQGVKTIMAGSFLGVDDYCVQKRIYGKPEQLVMVCDDTGIVCSYDIDLQ